MDEAKLRTIAQLKEFLDATQEISFTGAPGNSDHQRYEHISRVLKRFAYPGLGKGERGVVLAYLITSVFPCRTSDRTDGCNGADDGEKSRTRSTSCGYFRSNW